ncbi:Hypothetical protein D9617_42g090460 [Elsinoe fawcettii]|nr:Hypothetical protein D9617_42g090460 [Elsinoe fawcettii]
MSIEAQSLASISDLAFNPPAHCDEPLNHDTSSLTLYIVRVPGSRDVFLTPLKPRDRVVNAQDVQSSLYFLHVNTEEDVLFEAAPPDLTSTPAIQEEPFYPIARKPVGGYVARKPLPTPPASPGLSQGEADPWSSKSLLHAGVPLRKPLVPRRSPDRELRRRPISSVSSEEVRSIASLDSSRCQTLTLIRRDPASGQQWNVADINDPPVEEISSESLKENHGFLRRTKNAGSPMYIEIHNSGYTQFVQPDLPPRLATDRTTLSPTSSPTPEERAFKRRLWMDGSRFANHNYTSRRPLSIASFDTSGSAGVDPSVRSSKQSSPAIMDRRSKGYAFKDTWGNKCEFSTAATGRSLRCRQVRNAAVMSEDMGYVEVSELRFNLPSHHFSSKSESSTNNDASSRRNSYFSTATGGSDLSSVRSARTRCSVSEDGSVDYSLGRERAGGGFGGRETKLGKLIVEETGQKMLDLAVATNMALWWRAYEKCS